MENSKTPSPKRSYSASFKLQVVQEYERGFCTKDYLMHKYKIGGHSTVLRWLRKYGKLHYPKSLATGRPMKDPEKQRIKELEAQLKQAQQKILVYEKVFEIAKREDGIDLIKNTETKLSKNWQPKKEISVELCCRHLGYSKQAYYKKEKNSTTKFIKENLVIERVLEIRKELPRVGTRKLHYMLGSQISMGRDKLFQILRENDLLVKKVRKYVKTTNSKHWMKTYQDLSKDIIINRAEKLWVSDITYLSTKQESLYLHLVTDAYSKKIMGYNLSKDLRAESTLSALTMALKNRQYSDKQLTHHSDRGLQYCSKIYVNKLLKNNCNISMTQSGCPYDNAIAERVNGILKDEFLCDTKFLNFDVAKKHIKQAIENYNSRRPHLSCYMLTPIKMHLQNSIKPKIWYKKTSRFNREV
ncbi:MAG: IS3 family transposase [Rhodothermaceae bacterium]